MLIRSLICSLLMLLLGAGASEAQTSSSPDTAFKRLAEYLQNNPLDFQTTFDARSGGNELYRGKGHFLVRRPNQMRAEITLGGKVYWIISDGTVLTIYDVQQRKYSQTASPATVSSAFGFFAGEIGIDSQVLNFMEIVDNTVSGSQNFKVTSAGSGTIDGKACDRFAVASASGDDTWQAWLEKGDKPLLCRLVYQSVDGPAQTNTFAWKSPAVISAESFTFSPPTGSAKVDIGDLNLVSP